MNQNMEEVRNKKWFRPKDGNSNQPISFREVLTLSNLMIFAVAFLLLHSCNSTSYEKINEQTIANVESQSTDELVLSNGFNYEVLVKGLDSLTEEEDFGFDVSGIAYLPINEDEGMLWVNHELMNPKFVSGYFGDMGRTRKQIKIEEKVVGASYIPVRRNGDHWVRNGARSVSLSAKKKIGFFPDIFDGKAARGTVANRAVLLTERNTVLTAESHFEDFYGDLGQSKKGYNPSLMHWESFFRETPTQYGWVIETNLKTGKALKLTAPGRLKRGGIALNDKTLYYSDNKAGGCFYKFVSNQAGSFESGSIYVADLVNSQWIEVSLANKKLNLQYEGDEKQMLINLSDAGILVGGTPLDNPAGVAINPITKSVFLAESYSLEEQKYFGRVLEIQDDGTQFSWDSAVLGGEESGLSSPSNLTFDTKGNLWISSSIPSSLLNEGVYQDFGNNGLFVLKNNSSELTKVASAPNDAEFGGIAFAPGDQFIFVGVQHPGARTKSVANFDFTSHWPGGGERSLPKSAVVVVGKK